MSREFFCAYHSYLETMEALTDAEKGRLFTACLIYSKTGEVPQLSGNERFVFPAFKGQIDRDTSKFEAKCQKNRESAGKRWNANANEHISSDTKYAKEKEKEKEKEKSVLSPLPPQGNDRTDIDELESEVKDQIEYEVLLQDYGQAELDEIVCIITDVLCARRPIRIGGTEYPYEIVRKRLLSLTAEHITHVLENRGNSNKPIRNVKSYLLAMLYNAPAELANHSAVLFNYHQRSGMV